jgi:hypothetical protein
VAALATAHADGPAPVKTREEIVRALAGAKPGTRVRIAPGTYEGGITVEGPRGTPEAPVVVEAQNPANPPVFVGGGNAFHFRGPSHLVLRSLVAEGWTGNGVNVDDAGTPGGARDVTLEGLVVRNDGPRGNRDGLKLSGVAGFRVLRCTVLRWGRGGSAVDLVGCRDGTIEGCTFRHDEGSEGTGVQAKGGSRDVVVRGCRFEHAGDRGVNVGGSTGLEWFRPPLAQWKGERWEAKDVTVDGNVFVGGRAPVAFVGVDGASFRNNTVWMPTAWAVRILQETTAEGFVPSRRGSITNNVFAFRSDWRGAVNVGPGTEPKSFAFDANWWWCVDAPARTRELVVLPSPQKGPRWEDPAFRDPAAGDFRPRAGAPVGRDRFGANGPVAAPTAGR